ncbi:MAG: GNAT family N-acetyltransferase [Brevibacterium sp.]|uniref:GNAT family N-acetyltransferase n=1 Tax=Brevibacterium sp. TaxID=1701 RepID=UPI0026498B24|nr:GNAT family N-acetyltransferase [Brevibacterium sp.]MDN6135370.1 GNAT family N-acetyltransferase [Brevibacterium sp.]MDN6158717.1 GNAT family N-acetyltransferase [Brevibacterium sp.]MDN6175478.1 GNAT family N-acetyltransferase [Brevibacterium sp.]MDN6188863.1 GNAT family N-acetyltransferase [Brevibacterium sp.]MDN6190893.1 GNAT family N-acetyltransferase [Brevibacterium sp.]
MSQGSRLVVKTFDELTIEELYGIMQLRSQVFVVEQNCVFLDQDGVDTLPQTLHTFYPDHVRTMQDTHGAEVGRSLAPKAYARMLPPDFPDGPAFEPGARSISRVVTNPQARGGGWARSLIGELVAGHRQQLLTLNAQTHLEAFYSSFGFSPNGPRFFEDGIEHTPMARPADA